MKKMVFLYIASLTLSVNFFSTTAFAADISAGKAKAAGCSACHGVDGNGNPSNLIWPKLAGQGEAYLIKQMTDFSNQHRVDGTMNAMIMTISKDDFANVAAYFASLPTTHSAVEDKFFELGQTLYRAGDTERKVTACGACHGANGAGMAAAGFPSLSGQNPDYVIKQLKMFRDKTRQNDTNEVMRDITHLMSDKQINAIAHYVAGLH